MADIQAGRLNEAQIRDNFSELHEPLNELQAIQESARCLFCHDAPCIDACPTDIDIPGFIRKISTGNVKGAAVTILSQNIMGGTCANVCPVEELCEQVCVKNTSEEKPVVIGLLQRYATDHLFESGEQPFARAADTGKHIAVVGAGPAGLACAHRLAMLGHQVTVFESRDKPGGLNEFGIAAYKMLNERAAREVEFILGIGGIELKTGTRLGREVSLDALREVYDAVFLGLGHNAVNSLGLDNEDSEGVFNAVDFIEQIRQQDKSALPVGRRVVVIGGGNTAIDIAVQIKKLGAEYVTMVYRRGTAEMSATDYEQEVAQTNGVLIKTWAQPVAIQASNGKVSGVEFEYTENDADGNMRGTGETFNLPADQVFKAIGQHFVPSVFEASGTPEMQGSRVKTDGHGKTSLGNVWAGGDCVTGQDLTVAAVQDGKVAAHSINEYLNHG
ncbi:MAG: NAD(P)-dependent oxidoreductase [Xanthomonadales bacterium]|nr:NAD(P)-dependent oxidoreductase [Xanthomonadales bacterium]NNL95083.1 NAD(P)-dependent oxidoreductase [Xanthomonadales bacterium]